MDKEKELSEPGTGVQLVLPHPSPDITNGWRRDTPGGVNAAFLHPPQIGDTTYPPGIYTGEEL